MFSKLAPMYCQNANEVFNPAKCRRVIGYGLIGSLPTEISTLMQLQELALDNFPLNFVNNVNGSIPESYSALTRLRVMCVVSRTYGACV
jgi:hypothetical protein